MGNEAKKTPQKLLDSYWYRNSSRGPKPCKLYDYDEADDDHVRVCGVYAVWMLVVLRWGGLVVVVGSLEFYNYDFSVSLCSKYNINRI